MFEIFHSKMGEIHHSWSFYTYISFSLKRKALKANTLLECTGIGVTHLCE